MRGLAAALAVLALAGAALKPGQAPAQERQAAPPAAEVERRTDALAAQLRCPVCQALSVRDSPSKVAAAFRGRIRELVAAGRSDEEVRAFFVARYGDWILLSPPRRGLGLAAWVLPPAILLAGLALVALAVRRWTRRAASLAAAGASRPAAVAAARERAEALERSGAGGSEGR